MIARYEQHIAELEAQRRLLEAQASEAEQIDTSFEGAVGTVFDFISNPYSIWDNGDLEDKRLVVNMAFATRLPYDKNNGFGTVRKSLPFSVLGDMCTEKSKMVVCAVSA